MLCCIYLKGLFFGLQEDRECRIQCCPEVGQMVREVRSIVSVHRIGMINTGNTGPLPRLAELRLAHRR